jgi:hypothetical protein
MLLRQVIDDVAFLRSRALDHITDQEKPTVARKWNAAYALHDYAAANGRSMDYITSCT